jgi:capsular polysaccharide transport system permease protein
MTNQSHNWFEKQTVPEQNHKNGLRRGWDAAAAWRYPVLLILLPTLIVAAYYYLVAANQYESEAHFIVSSNAAGGDSAGGFGSLFGISAGGSSQSQTMAVPDYLESHDAVAALGKRLDLVAMLRRPEADVLSRLGGGNPTPEVMQRYFEKMVKVHYNGDTGITTLTVHAFRPADAHAIADQLLQLSEEQVNRMNHRRYGDAVSAAQAQVVTAQKGVAETQGRITAYRQQGRDIDPETSGESQIHLVSTLKAQLATAQATLATMGASISRSSPQYLAMQRQIISLRGAIGGQSAELTGGSRTIASNLGGYEDLRVQQQFAAKNYEAASAGLVKAQEEAARQQLYVVRVVDANMPVKSLFPQRGRIVFMTFLALCVAYGIGWLILAGVREHAA